MNVADIQVFARVAATRSFAEAAQQLGITRSAVSKCISRLESELGVTLLNRSPRSASLTEAGRTFFEHSLEVDAALARAVASVSGADQRPSGNVSCSMPTSLGASLMPPLMRKFRKAWPDVTLNLHFDDRYVDLVGSSIDVAIRVAPKLEDSNLLSRRIGMTRELLVASPGYIEKHGMPENIQALREHRCIALGSATRRRTAWHFDGSEGVVEITLDAATTANNMLALILAACMDDGIIYMPELFLRGELARGLLLPVLPEASRRRTLGVFAVCPAQKPAAKVRAFVDFIEEELTSIDTLDRWSPLATKAMNVDEEAALKRRSSAG